ncbi:MAG: hypothetical protein ABIJ86_08490, partial [Spirochaetota bacterium]
GDDTLHATREVIVSRWFLGSRRVTLHFRCKFDTLRRVVSYRETAKELIVGLPPPTLSFVAHRQRGVDVQEIRRDFGSYGGGEMRYGKARELVQSLCAEAGWSLEPHFIADV